MGTVTGQSGDESEAHHGGIVIQMTRTSFSEHGDRPDPRLARPEIVPASTRLSSSFSDIVGRFIFADPGRCLMLQEGLQIHVGIILECPQDFLVDIERS